MMGGMVQDKNVDAIVGTLEVFATSLTKLMAVFMNNYEGDDFCSGLIFGSNGA